ncbi:MAG: allophanate hydrolase [Hyphomicrobium sp.]
MSLSLDLATLAAGYASGTFTPSEVIEEVYRRIDADGERPIWITLVPKAEALAKTEAAPRGALYGIPFAVKDNIDVAGLPTTCACPEFAYVSEQSARVVELLEAAGAVLIGKTNLDQFATGLNGTRSPYGIPASAFDPAYISGGSSSGSAVAVAKGLVAFALGTDTAGSGRVPAAFNNLIGLKPSKGLISAHGVVPACRSLDCVSIFALTAADAVKVFEAAAVFDSADAFARQTPAALTPRPFPAALRVGIPSTPLEFFGDKTALAMHLATLARVRDLGVSVAEIDLTPFAETAKLLYSGPWVAERLAAIEDFAGRNPDAMHETVRGIILGARDLTATDAFKGFYRLAELTRQAEAEWSKMDVLLLPTAPTTYRIADMLADPVRLNSNLGLYTNFVNLMDLSALAVPAGMNASGLPFGVTLIGRAFDERLLATLGDRLHRTIDDATLGATPTPLTATPPVAPKLQRGIQVAVVGAHLSGQPLHGQLSERRARFIRTARTAPGYSFYALAGTVPPKPGLVFDSEGAGCIEVELYELDDAAFGSFVALIPPPLGIGTVKLDDGSSAKGFLCEAHAVRGALDITATGGWRAFLASRAR